MQKIFFNKFSALVRKNSSLVFNRIVCSVEKLRRNDVAMNVAASKSTSGTVCSPTIQTMIAGAFLWIGSYFRPVAFAVATPNHGLDLHPFLYK